MRLLQRISMIVCLTFYVLYPLSRYFFARGNSEASKTSLCPPLALNGPAAWDGRTVPFGSHANLPDQREEVESRMEGSDGDKSPSPDADEEPQTDVLLVNTERCQEPQTDVLLLNTERCQEPQTDVLLVNTERCEEQVGTEGVSAPKEKDGAMKQKPESDQLSVMCQRDHLTRDDMMETGEEMAAEPDNPTAQVSECWDEYVFAAGDVAPNQARAPGSLILSEPCSAQSYWHLPPGSGLEQGIQFPLWNLPAASYYPPMENPAQFEVMWRLWTKVQQTTLAPFKNACLDFTVMSYNVLAQDLLETNQHLYPHCPLEVLQWNYRCNLLLKEIEKWAPDILCLQEVQENHYHERLRPALSNLGYTCVYKRRTGTKTDGCAVGFRSAYFTEAAFTKLEFFRPDTGLLDRHNVGIVLLLRPLVAQGTGPLLCVANTHLLFNPRRGDVKLAQLAVVLAEIDAMVKSCQAKREHCSVVLCGDFNSRPYSPLYQLITTGELHYQGLPCWMVSGQEDLSFKPSCHRLFAPLWPSSLGISDTCRYTADMFEHQSTTEKSGSLKYTRDSMLQLRYCSAACVRPPNLTLIPGVTDNTPDPSQEQCHERRFRHALRHQLDLESVYKHILPGSGSPEVTTLHSEGGATVDYIFYSPKRTSAAGQTGRFPGRGLNLIGSLCLLSEDSLWSLGGLPNHIFPSDHLSLIARFQMDLNAA